MSSLYLVGADNIVCFDSGNFSNVEINSSEIKAYKKIFPGTRILSNEKIQENILRQRLFARAYLKEISNIDKELKREIKLVIEDFLAKKYIDTLRKKHLPKEDDLKSFYLDHKDRFKPMPYVDLSTIKLDSLDKADEIYMTLNKNPNKFEEIAKKVSLDSQIQYKNVPFVMLAPQVRAWIRNHQEGDISEPIKIGDYYYIDRIDKKRETNTSYGALKKDIREILSRIYISEKIEEEYRRLKKELDKGYDD
jgi:parvulin-like peptidyl-prolyl isomerase